MSTYVKDLLERILWTLAQAGVGFLVVESQEWEGAWVVVIAGILAAAKGFIARSVGTKDTAALGGGL